MQILTNSLASNDVVPVHAGYSKYRRPLLRCGVELHELNEALKKEWRRTFSWLPGLKKSGLHAKIMAFDKQIMFIGSFNFDQRSLHINNEIGLLFEQPDLVGPNRDELEQKIRRHAFKVELHSEADGRETLRWRGFENGQEVVFHSEPYASFVRKLRYGFSGCCPSNLNCRPCDKLSATYEKSLSTFKHFGSVIILVYQVPVTDKY